jgi:hypothetical protein
MSQEHRRTRALVLCCSLLFFVVLLASCTPEPGARPPIRGEPSVQATVVTIQTTIQPENRTYAHSLVIGTDRARSGDEVDRWRLFDFVNGRVTFVDDVARTYRIESVASLRDALQKSMSQDLAAGIPRVAIVNTGARRVIQGAEAAQIVFRAGSYVRELWIANHPAIPPGLFAMMAAGSPPVSSLAPMMKNADEALLASVGFPLADHAEITYGDKKLSVDHTVVKIEKRAVPRSWLNVPGSYQDVTPQPKVEAPAVLPKPAAGSGK